MFIYMIPRKILLWLRVGCAFLNNSRTSSSSCNPTHACFLSRRKKNRNDSSDPELSMKKDFAEDDKEKHDDFVTPRDSAALVRKLYR